MATSNQKNSKALKLKARAKATPAPTKPAPAPPAPGDSNYYLRIPIKTIAQIRSSLARVMRDVLNGAITPSQADSYRFLSAQALEIYRTAKLSERLEAVMQHLKMDAPNDADEDEEPEEEGADMDALQSGGAS